MYIRKPGIKFAPSGRRHKESEISAFFMDTSEVQANLHRVEKLLRTEVGEQAMGEATKELLKDSVQEIPQAPIKHSFLRGSGLCFVNNSHISHPRYGRLPEGIGLAQQLRLNVSIPPMAIIGNVAFTVPYAALQHENLEFKHSRPGTGPKYLEKPLYSNAQKYLQIMGLQIGKRLAAAMAKRGRSAPAIPMKAV